MPAEMPKQFDPQEAQAKWLAHWEAKGYFHSEPDGREPYTIVIPPPNVTGALHMGHALNNTLQDVLIRWKRMQGYNALWMPGTDHAGIATQAVVERLLATEDKNFKRREYGRENLVAKIWEWKDKYEARILGQLKQLGASCDWERTRFTLDEQCARAVRETFFRMFRDGYIYRGKRLVNWDCTLQTSVSDDETYTEDTKGGFWTFKYEVVGEPGTFIQFSTTRPETMLGDTALCVHPSDERYKHLVGKRVLQPLVNREIPIIADALLADPELGTGCVKVTPAHDPNDYACWTRNPQIAIINILNADGTINAEGGTYAGMDRFKAREAVVKAMEELGRYEGKEDRVIPLKFSDRSKSPIEPYLSDQWFVKMADRDDGKPGLAQMAMDAATSGRVKFFPERYAKTYLDWLGEKRDWCISRQLWWGHRIPVWKIEVHWSISSVPGTTQFDEQIAKNEIKLTKAISKVIQLLKSTGMNDTDYALIRDTEVDGDLWLCTRIDLATDILSELQDYKKSQLEDNDNSVKEGEAFPVFSDPFEHRPLLRSFGDLFEEIFSIVQEEDVLDTWFSSALWPHSTLGWPEPTPELKYYYPTSTLVTSRDIITLWVARMVLTGLYNLGDIPFHHVYITPKVLDGFGEGMSKSKGNGVDPLDIIELYGTDALRFNVVSIAGDTQDSRLPVANRCPHCGTLIPQKKEHQGGRTKKIVCPGDKVAGIVCGKPFRPNGPWQADDPEMPTAKAASDRFELGRNFANKLWNATRFILMNLEGYTPAAIDPKDLSVEDRWIVSRLATTARKVTAALEGYHFAEVAKIVYDFAWSEFCDWYIEMSKSRRTDPVCQRVLVGVLDGILRLIHPVMPFVSESLWHTLNEAVPVRGLPEPAAAAESCCIAPWPAYADSLIDDGTEASIARMQELVRGVREIRNRYSIDKEPLALSVKCSVGIAADFVPLGSFIGALANLKWFECGPQVAKPKQAASVITSEFEAYVALEGLIDPAAEVKRLEKQIAEKRKTLDATNAKLGNEAFTSKAPAEVVAQQRELAAELEQQIGALEANRLELA